MCQGVGVLQEMAWNLPQILSLLVTSGSIEGCSVRQVRVECSVLCKTNGTNGRTQLWRNTFSHYSSGRQSEHGNNLPLSHNGLVLEWAAGEIANWVDGKPTGKNIDLKAAM